jgi:general secretion pathway protein L
VAHDAHARACDEPEVAPIFMNNPSPQALPTVADFQPGELLRMAAASLRHLHQHPALAWITPQLPVRLIEAGGGASLWLGERKLEASQQELQAAQFTAVQVPPELALGRRLLLPRLSETDLRDAVALDVRDASPFDPADLVWGYRSSEGEGELVAVAVVLASRRQVMDYIRQAAPALADSPALEAWVLADDGAPVLLRGFGEGTRVRRGARGRMLAGALMIVAVMLATAIAVTPTVQLRLRTLQAVAAYQALQQRAGPAMAQREALLRGREDLANLQEVMGDHIEPLVAIDMLTQLIPDDTWLQRVQAQGTRFTVSGQTPNAAALMNMLSGNPGLRDVRAPSPATRAFGTNRETFVVEFTVTPGMLRRTPAAAEPTAPAGVIALPPVAPALPAVRSASMPAAPAAPAVPAASAVAAARPASQPSLGAASGPRKPMP